MIIVIGIFEVAGPDRPRFLDAKADQVAATVREHGCLDYGFAADAADPTRVRLVERWESMEDLVAHIAGLRSAPPPTVPPVPSTMVEVSIYEASPTTLP